MNKPAVIAITDAIPAEDLRQQLDVSDHSIRAARVAGSFPASWYGPLAVMCDHRGLSCPMDAFNWKSAERGRAEAQNFLNDEIERRGGRS